MELLKDIIYSHIVLFFICEAQSANNNNNTLNNNTDDYDFYNDDYDFYSDDYDFYSDDYDFYSDDYDNDYDNDYGHGPSIDTTTIYAELEEDYCADFYMCNSSSFIRTCNCDAMCEAYGDCCFEANLNNDLPSITDKERELTKFISCKLLPDVYDFWYMFVIDSCPPNSNYQHNKLCTNVDADDIYSITPATGKESGMIYRNMFCAMCHKEEFSLWIPEIFCSRNTPYTGNYTTEELLELDECRKNFLKSDSSVKVRMCHPFVSTCFSQNNGTSFVNLSTDACESFDKKVVFTPEKVYKNKYCYMCDDNRAGKVSCDPRVHNLTVSVVIRGDLYSLRLLFNLQDRVIKRIKDSLIYPRETEEVKLNSNCSTGHAFDPFAKTCRTIFCADEEKIENGKCVRMPANVSLNLHSEFCDSIQFKESEYVQHNETSITVLLSNKTYHGVHIENKTAFVCKNIRNTYQKRYSISDSEGILSLICNTISILFLIITICTYSFRQMRNMAGKILLGLSTSLCMAQLFFVLAPLAEKIPALCTIVAICIHYFYLSSFSWMNVMSYDVHNTFTTLLYDSKNNTKRFKFYSLYALFLPLGIVCSGFIIDKMTSTAWRPAYGSNICWISNSNGLVAFFLIPVATLVFSNVLFFMRTTWYIFRAKRNSAKKFDKRDRCEILIYFKLSAVMGLTWVFAYVAIIFNEDVFWYISIILNGSQGLLIFCSFVLNKNVCGKVREKIKSKKFNKRSNVYSSTL